MSLGLNPYNDRMPSSFYTTYENSLTGDKIIKTEPQCVNGYCNDNGDCEVIDIAITCKCNPTYLGKQCFIDKNGYSEAFSEARHEVFRKHFFWLILLIAAIIITIGKLFVEIVTITNSTVVPI